MGMGGIVLNEKSLVEIIRRGIIWEFRLYLVECCYFVYEEELWVSSRSLLNNNIYSVLYIIKF